VGVGVGVGVAPYRLTTRRTSPTQNVGEKKPRRSGAGWSGFDFDFFKPVDVLVNAVQHITGQFILPEQARLH